MFKKVKNGVEIDSQAADRANAPRFGKRNSKPEQEDAPKPFGKKKARKAKIANLLAKSKKGK